MANFTCNVCGAACEQGEPLGREVPSCAQCGSTVRLRALVALLSREIFGVELALPHMPVSKSVRGFGMSDPPALAARIAEKFDYTNTFYHQPPVLDITKPPEEELGTYDFIISSEVMEHVPPPVEQAFANLHRLLKPSGLLMLTVPYSLHPRTTEHYPELHEYALASPGGRTVLVNRRRDGSIEVFENLCFHGGDGSTLEMRVFSEASLKSVLAGAGFDEVCIASQNIAEFGVDHAETWSLPIVARKGKFQAPAADVVEAYVAVSRRVGEVERELQAVRSEYASHVASHERSHGEMEKLLEERAAWALRLDREVTEARAQMAKLEGELSEARAHAAGLDGEVIQARAQMAKLEGELSETRAHAAGLDGEVIRARAQMAKLEGELSEARAHAAGLDGEVIRARAQMAKLEGELSEARARAVKVDRELTEARARKAELDARLWVRLGRKLGGV